MLASLARSLIIIAKFCFTNTTHRRRKIFFSTGAKYNENKIGVGGDQWWIQDFPKGGVGGGGGGA